MGSGVDVQKIPAAPGALCQRIKSYSKKKRQHATISEIFHDFKGTADVAERFMSAESSADLDVGCKIAS